MSGLDKHQPFVTQGGGESNVASGQGHAPGIDVGGQESVEHLAELLDLLLGIAVGEASGEAVKLLVV